ncbi:antibiotic biosynthesis monooxygenase [Gramella lutea]|uniref:Antibiotic biosynthesis monooxygenase n=1 Tax=Christiangramia lutea TaxID=1607951 RepID=A0A9X2AA30_9FLAO|nr:putative quinol monooxygenase [Christiangramia lutea]MCH4822776.1 antibiotic biosynthesis monooxygenase [Christiangramia lutea]
MKFIKVSFIILSLIFLTNSCGVRNNTKNEVSPNMLIRISEIKIYPQYIEEYKAILKKEAEASVRIEPGVISIFPMIQKGDSTEIRILEIYANNQAYKSHLETPHFKEYKTTTLKMVESLKLIDMEAIDSQTMPEIFNKINNQ